MKKKLEGKTCLITGATNGIGKKTTIALSLLGAEIIFIARNETKADLLKERVYSLTGQKPISIIADLSSQKEIKDAVIQFNNLNRPLDILLNNAGILNLERKETIDGFEEMFAVNHLAYYSLTLLLLNKLKLSTSSRIVNVSSNSHSLIKQINFEDIHFKNSFNGYKAYGLSKLANILFTKELSLKLSGSNISVNCLHPGFVSTGIGSQNSYTLTNFAFLRALALKLARPFAKNSQQGASTSIFLCSSEEVNKVSGEYFVDCKIKNVSKTAENKENSRLMWEISEDLTGIKFY